jgi:hypothetical protein
MIRLFLALMLLLPFHARGSDMPPEVQKLQQAVESIPGITDAAVGKAHLADIPEADFGLLPYGDLPLGVLRRTKGGLDHEVVIAINFGISADVKGLKALEFISWWVRDAARGAEPIQVRSLALPPVGDQSGTLRFNIDYFHVDPDEDLDRLLARLAELAEDLESAKRLYPHAVAP